MFIMLNEKPLLKVVGPLVVVLTMFLVLEVAPGRARAAGVDDSQALQVFRDSPTTRGFFDNAYGYAIFPLIGKGGVVRSLGTAAGTRRSLHKLQAVKLGGPGQAVDKPYNKSVILALFVLRTFF
jgi:hypothetical protein